MMFIENIDELEKYLRTKSIDEILRNSLEEFYGLKLEQEKESLKNLKDKFNREEFNETSQNIDYFVKNIQDMKDNIGEYIRIYQVLEDEKSRMTYIAMLNAKLTIDNQYIEKVYEENDMYFDSTIYDISKVDVYVDCGAYIGDSAIKFFLKNKKCKKIFAFEPIKKLALKANRNMLKIIPKEKFVVIEKASYDFVGEIAIEERTLGNSEINNTLKPNIQATTLDSEIVEQIDLIKYDIEGVEKEAIRGSKEHILNDHPILVVCVYHKEDDFWKIPQLVLSIREDYKVYMRQYDSEVYSETVMYFVPPAKIINRFKTQYQNKIFDIFKLYTYEENENLVRHVKDKKWFIRQIRYRNIEIEKLLDRIKELIDYAKELEKDRMFFNEQSLIREQRIGELESWIKELERDRIFFSEQSIIKEQRINELESWIGELEKGKKYLEVQRESIQKELEDILDKDKIKIEALEQEILKLNYKLNLLKKDIFIKKIIKYKKYEI